MHDAGARHRSVIMTMYYKHNNLRVFACISDPRTHVVGPPDLDKQHPLAARRPCPLHLT